VSGLPTLGKDCYFWGGLLVVLVLVVLVVLFLCLGVFLTFFVWVVSVVWLWLGGVDCANIMGRLAAPKTIASKLFFILISPCGIYFPDNSMIGQRRF
jgi:hypothetical protein